ncbi:MAG TPA: EamA family transporter [Syntrophomonadaceae bacterium]|nr:EamA family transporter [Syntrophomonadaceae bacterium]
MKSIYQGGIYLTLASSIWGGMYVVSKYTLNVIPPLTFLFIRYILALSLLVILCRRQQENIFPNEQRGLLLQIGVFGYFLSIAAQFIGTKLSTAHMGAVITALSPLFLSLFAVIMLKEKMTIKQALAILVAMAGVGFVLSPGWGSFHTDNSLGNLILVLAALFWGYYSALSRKASEKLSALQITTCGIFIAVILSLPFVFIEANNWYWRDILNLPILGGIIYVSFISTALAFFWWNKGLSLVPAHQAGLFFFFQPVVGTFLSWLILHEHITGSFFVGGILIMFGIYLSMNISSMSKN